MSVEVGDDTAAQTFRDGKDLHEEQAKRIHEAMGWEYSEPLADAERQIGKTSNFAALYSGGIPTVERQLGCDRSTARAIIDAFHADNPKLGRWVWRGRGFVDPEPDTLNGLICSTLRERGYIRTLWGRHLHPEEDRKALNALIQGGAADLMKKAMVEIAEGVMDLHSHMVLSVHDEVGIDCVQEEVPYLLEQLPIWMGDETIEEILPVVVETKRSDTNWAAASD